MNCIPRKEYTEGENNKRTSMPKVTVFSQVIRQISRELVEIIAKRYEADKYSKGLATWVQLVSLLFVQLSRANSLRDVCNALKSMQGQLKYLGTDYTPTRNALSHQNQVRDWRVFRDIFFFLKKYLGQQIGKAREYPALREKNILLLDSSTVTLCLKLFPWANYQQEKGAIKIHTVFNARTHLPMDLAVTDGTVADNMGAYKVFPAKRSVIVADRGYNDTELWNDWDSNGHTFVVRFKGDIQYKRIKEREQPDEGEQNILIDEIIELSGREASKKYKGQLRRIAVYRPYEEAQRSERSNNASSAAAKGGQDGGEGEQSGKQVTQVIELITNNMDWSAGEIAELYRQRWDIESFFKILKQHLNITSFIGTSEQAVRTQIWVAMIAYLIMKVLKKRASHRWTLGGLVRYLQISLLSTQNLFSWLNRPYDISGEEEVLVLNST